MGYWGIGRITSVHPRTYRAAADLAETENWSGNAALFARLACPAV